MTTKPGLTAIYFKPHMDRLIINDESTKELLLRKGFRCVEISGAYEMFAPDLDKMSTEQRETYVNKQYAEARIKLDSLVSDIQKSLRDAGVDEPHITRVGKR